MEGWSSPDQAEAQIERSTAALEEVPLGRANRLAVTALICSMAIPFLLVAGILGTVFGMVALDEIEESDGAERGQGMAKWAIGLGFLNIVLSVAVIVLLVAVVAN